MSSMTNQRRTPSKNSQKTTKTCELKQKPLYSDKFNNNEYDKAKNCNKSSKHNKKKQIYISMILFQFSRQEINEALVLHNKPRFYVAQRLGH